MYEEFQYSHIPICMVLSFERLVWLTPQKYTEMAILILETSVQQEDILEVSSEETKTEKKLKKLKKKINSLLYSLREV